MSSRRICALADLWLDLLVHPSAQVSVHPIHELRCRAVGEGVLDAKGPLEGLEDEALVERDLEARGIDELIGEAGEGNEVVSRLGPLVAPHAAVLKERILGGGGDGAGEKVVLCDAEDGLDVVGAGDAQDVDLVRIAYDVADGACAYVKLIGQAEGAVITHGSADEGTRGRI